MSGIEQKTVLEAIKPAAGFVSAVLAPKVERLQRWAKTKDLEKEVSADKLSETMATYLTKLAGRVSEITAVIFPQTKLNMEDAYEPLKLQRSNMYLSGYLGSKGSEYELFKVISSTQMVNNAHIMPTQKASFRCVSM